MALPTSNVHGGYRIYVCLIAKKHGETEKKTIKNWKTQKKLIMSKRRRNLG